tara:strand:- start:3865 stop:4080 length:216 start_codon:yes stop_codon:yes gene_type:complete
MTRFRVSNRGAFARHLQAQVDSDGNNLDLIKNPEDREEKSNFQPSDRVSSQLKFQQKLDENRRGSNPSAFM